MGGTISHTFQNYRRVFELPLLERPPDDLLPEERLEPPLERVPELFDELPEDFLTELLLELEPEEPDEEPEDRDFTVEVFFGCFFPELELLERDLIRSGCFPVRDPSF